eukprot:scaffold7624_cov248-Pinguiococcus_pyrenoidosus.AAC.1
MRRTNSAPTLSFRWIGATVRVRFSAGSMLGAKRGQRSALGPQACAQQGPLPSAVRAPARPCVRSSALSGYSASGKSSLAPKRARVDSQSRRFLKIAFGAKMRPDGDRTET